jgi:DNA-binding NarL/FixJ family response regulator
MPLPFMIEIGHAAATRQARSNWARLTPTQANVAKRVEEGLSNPEIAATLVLSCRIVAATSRISCRSLVHLRIDIAREAALRATAAR